MIEASITRKAFDAVDPELRVDHRLARRRPSRQCRPRGRSCPPAAACSQPSIAVVGGAGRIAVRRSTSSGGVPDTRGRTQRMGDHARAVDRVAEVVRAIFGRAGRIGRLTARTQPRLSGRSWVQPSEKPGSFRAAQPVETAPRARAAMKWICMSGVFELGRLSRTRRHARRPSHSRPLRVQGVLRDLADQSYPVRRSLSPRRAPEAPAADHVVVAHVFADPGNSCTTWTPSSCRCAPSPMPESCRSLRRFDGAAGEDHLAPASTVQVRRAPELTPTPGAARTHALDHRIGFT